MSLNISTQDLGNQGAAVTNSDTILTILLCESSSESDSIHHTESGKLSDQDYAYQTSSSESSFSGESSVGEDEGIENVTVRTATSGYPFQEFVYSEEVEMSEFAQGKEVIEIVNGKLVVTGSAAEQQQPEVQSVSKNIEPSVVTSTTLSSLFRYKQPQLTTYDIILALSTQQCPPQSSVSSYLALLESKYPRSTNRLHTSLLDEPLRLPTGTTIYSTMIKLDGVIISLGASEINEHQSMENAAYNVLFGDIGSVFKFNYPDYKKSDVPAKFRYPGEVESIKLGVTDQMVRVIWLFERITDGWGQNHVDSADELDAKLRRFYACFVDLSDCFGSDPEEEKEEDEQFDTALSQESYHDMISDSSDVHDATTIIHHQQSQQLQLPPAPSPPSTPTQTEHNRDESNNSVSSTSPIFQSSPINNNISSSPISVTQSARIANKRRKMSRSSSIGSQTSRVVKRRRLHQEDHYIDAGSNDTVIHDDSVPGIRSEKRIAVDDSIFIRDESNMTDDLKSFKIPDDSIFIDRERFISAAAVVVGQNKEEDEQEQDTSFVSAENDEAEYISHLSSDNDDEYDQDHDDGRIDNESFMSCVESGVETSLDQEFHDCTEVLKEQDISVDDVEDEYDTAEELDQEHEERGAFNEEETSLLAEEKSEEPLELNTEDSITPAVIGSASEDLSGEGLATEHDAETHEAKHNEEEENEEQEEDIISINKADDMDQDDSSMTTDDTPDKSLPYRNQESEQSSSQDPILVETKKVVEQADGLTKDDNDIEADSKEALDEPELGLEQEVEEEQEHSVQEPSEPSQDMDSRASTEKQPQEDQEPQEELQSLEEEPQHDNYDDYDAPTNNYYDKEPDMNEDDDQYLSRETEGEEEEVDEQGQFPSQSEIPDYDLDQDDPDYDLDQDDPDYESHSQDKGTVASSTPSRRTSSRFVKAVICHENEQVGVVAGVSGSVEVEESDTRNEAVENEQEKENLNESHKSSTDLFPTNAIPTPAGKHSQTAPPVQLTVNNTIITPTPIRVRTPTTPRATSSSSSPTHNFHFGPKSDAAPSTQRTTQSQPIMKKRKNLNQTKKKKLQILSDIELSDSDDETPTNQSLSIISQQIIKDIPNEKKASKPLRIGQLMKLKEEREKLEENTKVKVSPIKPKYHQFRRPISPPRVSLRPVVFSLDSEPEDEDELVDYVN